MIRHCELLLIQSGHSEIPVDGICMGGLSMLNGILGFRRHLILFGLLLAGCGHGSTRIIVPKWDAEAATERAMSDYDADGNQKLSREELKRSPGLLYALKFFDGDGDGAISVDELKSKLKEMREQQAAIVEAPCSVTRGG